MRKPRPLLILAGIAGAVIVFILAIPILVWVVPAIQGELRFNALENAQPSAPFLQDFQRLYPNAEVNFRYFGGNGDQPGFHVTADLHERYELNLFLPARFNSTRTKVVGFANPAFQVLEVESVEGRSVSYTGNDRNFGEKEWQKIVESGGDFGTIGYGMVTNNPVPGFKERKLAE